MGLSIRLGAASDQEVVVDHMILAGDGIFEQMFKGVFPGLRPRDILRLAVCEQGSPYYIENSVLVFDGDKAQGCMVAFPESEYYLPGILKAIIPKKRLAPLNKLFESRIHDSLYINTLTISTAGRGSGMARLLLDAAREMALTSKFDTLSLHVWADNEPAMRLYEKAGFKVVEEISIPQTKYLHHEASMLLLKCRLDAPEEAQ